MSFRSIGIAKAAQGSGLCVAEAIDLPDAAGWDVDFGLAGFAVKGFLEFGHVADDVVYAQFFGRMGIGEYVCAKRFGADLAAPAFRIRDEEALEIGEAVRVFVVE